MIIASTAWAADTVQLTSKTLVTVQSYEGVNDVAFAYLEPLDQRLVRLSVDSYNAKQLKATGCYEIEHDGYPLFACVSDDTVCYTGWVVPEGGSPELEIRCGDTDPVPQAGEVWFECYEEQICSNSYGGARRQQAARLVSATFRRGTFGWRGAAARRSV